MSVTCVRNAFVGGVAVACGVVLSHEPRVEAVLVVEEGALAATVRVQGPGGEARHASGQCYTQQRWTRVKARSDDLIDSSLDPTRSGDKGRAQKYKRKKEKERQGSYFGSEATYHIMQSIYLKMY